MATETHAAEQAPAMPQLDPSSFPNQIFWLVVALVAIYLILTRTALPRIASVLAERRGTITNDIAAAEELKLKAQEAERAYEKALAEAREEASQIVAKARNEMRADLDAALQRADAQISAKTAESEKRIADIRASAEKSVAEVARDTAEAVVAALGGKADAKSVAEAVSNRMKG